MNTNNCALWVPATPFRAVIVYLMETYRMPWRVIAHAAGVASPVVRGILHGRVIGGVRKRSTKIRTIDAKALYNLLVNADRLAKHPANQLLLRRNVRLLAVNRPQAMRYLPLYPDEIKALLAGHPVWASAWQQAWVSAVCEAYRVHDDGDLLAA